VKRPRRELFQYDGCLFIGTIIVDRAGQAKAFGRARNRLGTFPDFRSAMAAISMAHLGRRGLAK
jgi:hypothetical protein